MKASLFSRAIVWLQRAIRRSTMYVLRPAFYAYGRNFVFDPSGTYSFGRIQAGHDVFLGVSPAMLATNSRIVIGNKLMFGPHVTVVAGNHNI